MSRRSLKIALIQAGVKPYAVDANLAMYGALLARLRHAGARLTVLPEFFPTGNTLEARLLKTAVGESEKIKQWLMDQAKALDMIIVGSFLSLEQGEVFNRFAWQEPERALNGRRKTRIPAAEAIYSIESNDSPIVETSLGKVGMIICAESFAPEIVQADYSQCALVLMNFAIPHLFTLAPPVRSRLVLLPGLLARKNGVPAALCSMGGAFSTTGSAVAPWVWKGRYAGRSGVHLPDGKTIGPLKPGEKGVVEAEIHLGPGALPPESGVTIPAGLPRAMGLYDRVFKTKAERMYSSNLQRWLG